MSKTNNPHFKKIAFYIISTKNKSKKNIFKIGIHTGTVYSLLSRYVTYIMNPIVHYFQYINEAASIEKNLKNELYDYRQENGFGNKSEWVKMPYELLYEHVRSHITHNYNIVVDKYGGIDLPKNHVRKILYNKNNTSDKDNVFDKKDKGKLLSNIDETKYKISDLMKKQSQNKLTKQEKLILEKHFFKKTFGIKSTKNKKEFENFYEEFHDKDICVKRFENYFQYKNNYDNDTEIDDYNNGKEKVRQKIVTPLRD
ncbi:helicase [Acanthamoeba polyphaga moumouvirus]|uniref:Helicase n=1 Tax=Acanthamoeba polyphaga moumouvirus TaxID=1269028 RepID=L7RBM7_9VIRU|nr:helicase [Acanthamoeba polyphaga moumouvirus]AGC01551.1 helicase [Acanthamoeba polyphaga moumouvirus]